MKFKAYTDLDGHKNLIVDGSPHKDSALVLSHWKGSGTSADLIRDTSAEIVLDFIESNEIPKDIQYVSNDHFDEDGLIGIFAILNREFALANKELLIDIAEAGDFGRFRDERSAKIIFTIQGLLKKDSGFIANEVYDRPYPEMAAEFYRRTLEELPKIIENVDSYENIWNESYNFLKNSEKLIEDGVVRLEELIGQDIIQVVFPDDYRTQENNIDKFIHEMAINNKSKKSQILFKRSNQFIFKYKYESWVQYKSQDIPLRVNLSPLADKLTELEHNENVWDYEGSRALSPCLKSLKPSSIKFKEFYELLTKALNDSEVDWNPYER